MKKLLDVPSGQSLGIPWPVERKKSPLAHQHWGTPRATVTGLRRPLTMASSRLEMPIKLRETGEILANCVRRCALSGVEALSRFSV